MPQKLKDNTYIPAKDLFQTPVYATKLIIPYLVQHSSIWEPAAGGGSMVNALSNQGFIVYASDISSSQYERFDFLDAMRSSVWLRPINYIITNPPFSHKRQFFEMCWKYWEQHQIPFALLIPADYTKWGIDAVRNKDCIKLIPTQRINYISPTGKDERGGHTSRFHSLWLTKGIYVDTSEHATGDDYPTEIYVELTKEMKKDI